MVRLLSWSSGGPAAALLTLLSAALLFLFPSVSSAAALTYTVGTGERACFYTAVPHKDLKVLFYFAVQSGGSFELNYDVTDPSGHIIFDGERERQGEFVFTAKQGGDYAFCLNNPSGIFSADHPKMVDFEITVEKESKIAKLPAKQGSTPEQTTVIEDSLIKVSNQVSTLMRSQKYMSTRENRNFSTVKSTEARIFNFSVIQGVIMVAVAVVQVAIVKHNLSSNRKGESVVFRICRFPALTDCSCFRYSVCVRRAHSRSRVGYSDTSIFLSS